MGVVDVVGLVEVRARRGAVVMKNTSLPLAVPALPCRRAAAFVGVHEDRFLGGAPRGDQADTTRAFFALLAFDFEGAGPLEHDAAARLARRARVFTTTRHTRGLVLIHIPGAVDVLRDEPTIISKNTRPSSNTNRG